MELQYNGREEPWIKSLPTVDVALAVLIMALTKVGPTMQLLPPTAFLASLALIIA